MWNALLSVALAVSQGDGEVEIYDELQGVDRVTPVVRVVQAVTPAVVFIETEMTRTVRHFRDPRRTFDQTYAGSGSGFVVKEEGYIVTNYHVVHGAEMVYASFAGNPTRYRAEVKSFVRSEDLALLRILGPEDDEAGAENVVAGGAVRRAGGAGPFPVVRLGTSSDLMPGERVVAIGNPHGQTHTVSEGIISGLHRNVAIPDQGLQFSDLIQTDASINLGNSGGPLLNIRGEVIGINTAMNNSAENIGFAIPVDRISEVLSDILFPQARESWLGFELAPSPGEGGAEGYMVVERVWPDGPAALAGVCEGDRILALGGRTLEDEQSYLLATLELAPNEPVRVRFGRGGERLGGTIRPWDKFDGLLYERLGLTVREVVMQTDRWLVVERIRPGGPAERSELRAGDLLPAIQPDGGRARILHGKRALVQIAQELPPGARLELEVYRDDGGDGNYDRDERYRGWMTLD